MPTEKQKRIFDPTWFVTQYEAGKLNRDQVIDGFQNLIDTGIAWRLSSKLYATMARKLIESGDCHECEGK